MGWITPKTWAPNDLVTAFDLNTQVRDNLSYLRGRIDNQFNQANGYYSTFNTSSTTFVNWGIPLTLTTTGYGVMIAACGQAQHSLANGYFMFDIEIDGTRLGHASYGSQFAHIPSGLIVPWAFTGMYGLPAGTHTFKMMVATSGGGGSVLTVAPFQARAWVLEIRVP